MAATITIRPPRPEEFKDWEPMWQGYCDFYEESVPPVVTENTWARLFDENEPLFGLVAEDENGNLIGFTNCVVHSGTWSSRKTCYLEDLFVSNEARGKGAGRALIESVLAKAKDENWQRVYWQTNSENAPARALYDKIAKLCNWVIYEVET